MRPARLDDWLLTMDWRSSELTISTFREAVSSSSPLLDFVAASRKAVPSFLIVTPMDFSSIWCKKYLVQEGEPNVYLWEILP